jgi:hypothetical protein
MELPAFLRAVAMRSVGLLRYLRRVCADGAGAGDMNLVADANGAGEADDRLERRGAGNVFAGHIFAWNVLSKSRCDFGSGVFANQ